MFKCESKKLDGSADDLMNVFVWMLSVCVCAPKGMEEGNAMGK